jgi:serine/threonine protein kinase
MYNKLIPWLDIIHGDVKPQNVLVFEDSPGIYIAKVADFGFSTHFYGEQNLISMPKSVPWSAPEHRHRYFCPQDAKAMDVYSFGMLCLWLLFGAESSETMTYPSGAANDAASFSFEARDWFQKGDLLLSWKRDRLLEWTIQQVTEDKHFTAEMVDKVTQFFRSSLCFDSQTRVLDWHYLLRLLALPQ